MRITLLAGEVGHVTSGQSRFLLNLAQGLAARSVDLAVCGSYIHEPAEAALRANGIRTHSLGTEAGRISQAQLLTLGSRVGRQVAMAAQAEVPADWYVVLSDAIVDAIEALPEDRSVYVCNGDLALLFLSPTFYASHPRAKRWLARNMSRYILQNAARARRFRVRVANSEFTRGLMSFLYATPFTGVLYPPVDARWFHPGGAPPSGAPYALAVARNENEQGLDLLAQLAREGPLKVVGGAEVAGAENLGRVPDSRLGELYRGAQFLAFPIVSELFGYAVAESLSCGTPVLAFDAGGPREQVSEGENGWLANSPESFLAKARDLLHEGASEDLRRGAVRSAERYSIDRAATRFLEHLA